MSYSTFTFSKLKDDFQVEIELASGLFATVPPQPVRPALTELLAENVPLASAIATEKAKSEMIVAPVLWELRRMLGGRVSLFSGKHFVVEPAKELEGICDFIITGTSQQFFIEAPLITIVEAKNDNLNLRLPQCIAAMIGAQLFNANAGHRERGTFGAVTTGSVWSFLKLEQQSAKLDPTEFTIREPGKILGILRFMVETSGIFLSPPQPAMTV